MTKRIKQAACVSTTKLKGSPDNSSLADIAANPPGLRSCNRGQLRSIWHQHFPRKPAPPTSALVLHELAFKAQASIHGGLDAKTQGLIHQAMRSVSMDQAKPNVNAPQSVKRPSSSIHKPLRCGTCLIRHWGGVAHKVICRQNRFTYREREYRSLTEVAQVITGAHWSGPRFFGLNKISVAG